MLSFLQIPCKKIYFCLWLQLVRLSFQCVCKTTSNVEVSHMRLMPKSQLNIRLMLLNLEDTLQFLRHIPIMKWVELSSLTWISSYLKESYLFFISLRHTILLRSPWCIQLEYNFICK